MKKNGSNENKLIRELMDYTKKQLIDISLPRIKTSIALLHEEDIWYRPNEKTVSVGNIILHLSGNLRQWIISGLGGEKDIRTRNDEFSEKGPIPTSELLDLLTQTLHEAQEILGHIDPDTLLKKRKIQGYDVTGVEVLLHVVEHFSYHVGQITYIVKSRKGVDVDYYKGVDLNQHN